MSKLYRTLSGTRILLSLIAVSFFSFAPRIVHAQGDPGTVNTLKRLSLEQLLNIEVTLVSKIPQRLSEVASAIQVITSEDIRRSGATRLPEALRLAANLMVAQSNSHDWAVTARGFNGAPLSTNTLANKLLVMIDGRTVYSPLFGGVFWDVQNLMLEDVDRIEIVSGPGGTLWGANAVNGVINIITKSAKDTKGVYASVAAGNQLKGAADLRYGGSIGSKLHYRLYGRYASYDNTRFDTGADMNDQWNFGQGGFRIDYDASAKDALMLSGDFYAGKQGDPSTAEVDGQYILGRWVHTFSDSSSFAAQLYADRTWRNLPQQGFNDDLKTYDLDLQHGFTLGRRHRLLWGMEYRLMKDNATNATRIMFIQPERTLQLVTGFIQDQISIIPRRLELTLGTKVLYNDYSHTDYQPSARLAWNASERHVIWAAASRAVRTPTRFDAEIQTPGFSAPKGQSFASEKVITYEAGYRAQLSQKASLSLAAFHSTYSDLRSINRSPNGPPSLVFANDQEGTSSGIELSGNYWVNERWRLRGGYTLFDKKITATDTAVIAGSDAFEGIDPRHQLVVQSILDLPAGFEWDLVMRYVSVLDKTLVTREVPEYLGLDMRLAKRIKWFELSVVGQNLLQNEHPEFGRSQIPRSIYGRLVYRFIR